MGSIANMMDSSARVLASPEVRCFHCGERCADGTRWTVAIDGRQESLCCPGCAAASASILEFGLADYYRQRDRYAPRPPPASEAARYAVYDDPVLLERCASRRDDGCAVTLTLAGLRCSACAWLLESRIGRMPGVQRFDVDFSARRATLVWDTARCGLADILAAAEALGYEARPFTPDARRELQRREARALLSELGVACVFGMQVMMIATAFYFGEGDASASAESGFLRWVSLVLTLPVVGYSARPYYRGAWRALAAAGVSMDVPAALAISLAFAGSAWNTFTGTGALYFDSVVMFVTLLSASRFLELRARVRAATELDTYSALVPDAACRVIGSGPAARYETVPSVRLRVDDRVYVRPGETVPADGCIVEGESALDEAILTGEAEPAARGVGQRALGGSINLESPLTIRVTAQAAESFAGQLARLVAQAGAKRPAHAEFGQRIAAWFVWGVLLTSAVTALYWAVAAPSRGFEATLAVLVVACPCALAIAMPAALAAAHGCLLARAIAVLDGLALEKLARATHFVFDKTGTLTSGHLALRDVRPLATHTDREAVLAVALALAHGSDHPIARALRALPEAAHTMPAVACRGITGRGMSGLVDGEPAALGSALFMREHVPDFAPPPADVTVKEVWVARAGRVLGRLAFDDALRAAAPALFAWLRARRYRTSILSGDRTASVAALAERCGADSARGDLAPADKLAVVAELQAAGAVVVMTGDGLNDAPVLAGADVSIAVADSSALARQQAGILLLAPDLDGIRVVTEVAIMTRRVMRQNLIWAAAYNASSVPLAAMGLIPPWLAALGMSLSSLAVVANALRIGRRFDRRRREPTPWR